jgi:hypothetical protein
MKIAFNSLLQTADSIQDVAQQLRLPDEETQATELRVVQPKAYSQKELDAEISTCRSFAGKKICYLYLISSDQLLLDCSFHGTRMEGAAMDGKATSMLDDDSTTKN